LKLIKEGKRSKLEESIVEIGKFINRYHVLNIISTALFCRTVSEQNKSALLNLLGHLSNIWNHHRFPFA